MKKTILTILLIAAFGLVATVAVGSMGGKKCGSNCPKQGAVAADPAFAGIQDRYAAEYSAIEQKMADKRVKMSAAWGKDTTTVGEINKLRNEMLELKKEYLMLNDKVQREYSEAKGDAAADSTAVRAACNGGCGMKGMKKKGCGKSGKDCVMQGGTENCPGNENCQKAADCPSRGNCKGQNSARCGDCPKQSS